RLPVIALAEPLADAARLASQRSPPSLPIHGATRTPTVHAICVLPPTLVISTFFTVPATMNARDRLELSSAEVGNPPGHEVEKPLLSTLRLSSFVTRSQAALGSCLD